MPIISKNLQTSIALGGWVSEITVTQWLAQGMTPAQIAFQVGLLPADVVRILALPTPT